MEYAEGTKEINWHIGIPIVLWIANVTLGIIKIFLSDLSAWDSTDIIVAVINTANSNTFSTFISIVVCMLYQYFTTSKAKREKASGLAMRYIPLVFILTGIYCVAAVFDAAISHVAMTVIYLIINIAYVACFFGVFLVRKKK